MDKQGIEPDALHGKSLLRIVSDAEDDGYSLLELAEIFDINYNTFKSRVYRAREAYGNKYKKPSSQEPQEVSLSKDYDNQNSFAITSKSPRIRTLEQLLEASEVDLDAWEVDHWIDNKWDGQLTGGAPVPLFQVKAWLIRTKPVEIEHTIQPVSINLGKLSKVDKKKAVEQRILIIPDIQLGFRKSDNNILEPFHDRRAMDIILQIAQDYYFDRVVVLGDGLDLSEFSDHFITEPGFYRTTQSALLEASWYLSQLKLACPEAEIDYIEGNHEVRFEKAMMSHLQSAYGLRPASQVHLEPSYSVPQLLDLETLGINWIGGYPSERLWINSRLQIKHGDLTRKHPGHASSIILRESDYSVVFGHIHKIEKVCRNIETPEGEKTIYAGSPGCVCRLDYQVPGHKKGLNWQQGFGIIYYNKEESYFEAKEIKDGKTIYNNKEYVARDRVEDLCNDTGWEF